MFKNRYSDAGSDFLSKQVINFALQSRVMT